MFRIRNSGGIVKSVTNNPSAKVIFIKDMPVLAITRSIGDYQAHQFCGVIAEPEVMEYLYTREDKMVVIASAGLFNVLSNQEVSEVAMKHYESG